MCNSKKDLKKDLKKDIAVQVRFSENLNDELEKYCSYHSITKSQYIRTVVITDLRKNGYGQQTLF